MKTQETDNFEIILLEDIEKQYQKNLQTSRKNIGKFEEEIQETVNSETEIQSQDYFSDWQVEDD